MKTILVQVDLKGAPEAIRNIDGLENAISSLEDELKQADFGSEEFKKLSKELTKARSELKNTELALEALDSEQVASEFGALTGAVGDVSGAFVLLGGEDGTVAQSVEKIQTAIGVSMAFKGAIEGLSAGRKLLNNFLATSNTLQKINNAGTVIATGIYKLFGKTVDATSKSFKGLRTAIIATGIGALVVGIGLLIANFDKLTKALSTTTAEQDAYNEASQKAIENVAKELSAADKLKDVLNDETITREEKNEAVKKLQEEYPSLLSNVDAEKNSIEEINRALELNTKLLLLKAKQEAVAELRTEKFKEIIQAQTEAQTGSNVSLIDHIATLQVSMTAQEMANLKTADAVKESEKQVDVLDNVEKSLQAEIDAIKELGAVVEDNTEKEKEAVRKTNDRRKEAKRKREKDAADKLAAANALAEKEAKDEADRLKRIEDNEKAHKQTLIDIENEFRAELEIESDLYNQQFISEQELEIRAVEDKYFRLIELAEQYGEDTTQLRFNQETAIADINQKFAKEELQAKQANEEAKIKMAGDALGAIGNFITAFAKEDEEAQRKAFNLNKAVSIAQALVNTSLAVTAALTAGGNPIKLATGAQFVEAGIAAVMGAAQVATIAKTEFQGGGGSTPPAPSGGLGGGTGATTQPPAFNVVGQSGFNQIAGALGQQPPIQTFVVSQDVTTAQQLDNAIIQTATF
tara:strand:- start:243 stop:2321 length:2079 start_codon:yes stop_codon:yes gene_type:complete